MLPRLYATILSTLLFSTPVFSNPDIGWIENKGQVIHEDNSPAKEVLYYSRVGDLDVYITHNGMSYIRRSAGNEIHKPLALKGRAINQSTTVSYNRSDIRLIGAHIANDNVNADKVMASHFNYYGIPGNTSAIQNVQQYEMVTFKSIYPGIDWVLYFVEDSLGRSTIKYDFLVAPFSDIRNVKIKVEGSKVSLSKDRIILDNDFGQIDQGQLIVLQDGKIITSGYEQDTQGIITHSANRDKSKAITIDPMLVWSTYYGGPGEDDALAGTIDRTGNQYMVGTTSSAMGTFPLQPGTGYYNGMGYNSGLLSYISKFNAFGVRTYSTYYGNGYLQDITTDSFQNVYVAGFGMSHPGLIQNFSGAYNHTGDPNSADGLIAKFDSLGNRIWGTFFGGTGQDMITSLCLDNAQTLIISGVTESADFPKLPSAGAYNQSSAPSNKDAFIARFNLQGALTWSTNIGGSEEDHSYEVKVDKHNRPFIVGSTRSPDFPLHALPGAFNDAAPPPLFRNKAFLIRFGAGGDMQWSTLYGSTGTPNTEEEMTGICFDSQNNLFVCGSSSGIASNIPLVNLPGAYFKSAIGGGEDLFICKFNTSGQQVWGTYFGGSGNETINIYPSRVAIDKLDRLYLIGQSVWDNANTLPRQPSNEPNSYYNPNYNANWDAFLARFNANGSLNWSTLLTSADGDFLADICIRNYSVLVVGASAGYGANILGPSGSYTQNYYATPITPPYHDALIRKFVFSPAGRTDSVNACGLFPLVLDATDNNAIGYTWNTAATTSALTVNSTGTYTVIKSFPNNVTVTDTFVVYNNIPKVNLGNDTTLCNEGGLLLDAYTQNAIYVWQDLSTNPTYFVTQTGLYLVTVSIDGCSASDSVNIIFESGPEVDLGNDTTVCVGTRLVLDAGTSGSVYLWKDGGKEQTNLADRSGLVWVEVMNDYGCKGYDTIKIEMEAYPVINLGRDTSICSGEILKLKAGAEGTDYKWENGSSDVVRTISQEGVYSLIASSLIGCTSYDSIKVDVINCNFYIPNAFSPNGDGLNDVFRILASEDYQLGFLYIYNRWGQKVFASQNIKETWDGSFLGEKCPVGVYHFQLSLISKTRRGNILKKGDISLLR